MRAAGHPYSLGNLLLIVSQRPTATIVRGYRAWQEEGRQVRKGERGLLILAPLTARITDDTGETATVIRGFRTTTVFDITQTDGPEYPAFPRPTPLLGDTPDARTTITLLTRLATGLGWTVTTPASIDGEALGSCTPRTRTLAYRSDLAPLQAAKTLAHELAHAIAGHEGTRDPSEMAAHEFEAETAAYLTLNTLGMDTSDYTFAYLASWAAGGEALDVLFRHAARATVTADTILTGLTRLTEVVPAAA